MKSCLKMALPVTPCQWVGQWLIVSDFGDSYRIYRACELVFNVIFNVHLFSFFERRVARSSWSEGRHGSLLTSVTQHIHNVLLCYTVTVLECYSVTHSTFNSTLLHSTFTSAIDPTSIVLYTVIKGNTQLHKSLLYHCQSDLCFEIFKQLQNTIKQCWSLY